MGALSDDGRRDRDAHLEPDDEQEPDVRGATDADRPTVGVVLPTHDAERAGRSAYATVGRQVQAVRRSESRE